MSAMRGDRTGAHANRVRSEHLARVPTYTLHGCVFGVRSVADKDPSFRCVIPAVSCPIRP